MIAHHNILLTFFVFEFFHIKEIKQNQNPKSLEIYIPTMLILVAYCLFIDIYLSSFIYIQSYMNFP